MSEHVFFAVAGTSPAVITEMAWHLCHTQRIELAEVEIWTTTRGCERLEARLGHGVWSELRRWLGGRGDPVPPPWEEVRVELFEVDGAPLDDVRSATDNSALTATLCRRVRALRRQGRTLHGLLSGGRKTMSAALQTAFELYSGPDDRLFHVLVHEAIEADRTRFQDFNFPSEVLTIREQTLPLDAQIIAVECPYPHLNLLLEHERPSHAAEVFQGSSYAELMETINTWLRYMQEPQRVTWQRQVSGRGALTLEYASGDITTAVLPPASADVYEDVLNWIHDHGTPREFSDIVEGVGLTMMDGGTVRTRMSQASRRLREALGPAAEPWLITNVGGGYTIPAHENIEVLAPE